MENARHKHMVASVTSWLVLVVLVAASVFAAGFWQNEARENDRQSFRQEASGVRPTITSSLRRLDDLMVVVRTRIGTDPSQTNRSLATWYRNLGARDRFRSARGFTFLERTPAESLSRFERR